MVGRGSGDTGKSNYIVRVDWEKIALDRMEHVLKLVGVDVQVLRSPCGSSDEMMIAWTKWWRDGKK